MQALVSGRAGVAILVDDERLCSIGLDPLDPQMPRTPRDVRFLLGDARDIDVLEGVDLATVRQRLAVARAGDDALQLALFLLDPDLSHATREEAAGALDELFGREPVRRFVEGVLFACPVPPSADLAGARELARRAPAVAAMLDDLAGARDAIAEVWRAWEALPPSLFQGEDDRATKRAAFVRAGMFRRLVEARRSGRDVAAVYTQGLRVAEVLAVRGHRSILEAWIAPFRAVAQLAMASRGAISPLIPKERVSEYPIASRAAPALVAREPLIEYGDAADLEADDAVSLGGPRRPR